jgi:transcriptional regulator with XRE-family HTH domain
MDVIGANPMNEQSELRRLGEAVRQVREQQRLSVADLAVRAVIDAGLIDALEAGRLDPRFDALIALARGMEVPISALCPDENQPRPLTDHPRPSDRPHGA